MRGRRKIYDEQEAVRKTIGLFRAIGYEGASTEELLEVMGIGKGSFYHAFPGGKKELFEKAMKEFSDMRMKQLREDLAKSPDKIGEIRLLFLKIAESDSDEHEMGCLLANTVTELYTLEQGLALRAARLLKEFEQVLFEVLQEARKEGKLKPEADPKVLAGYFVTMWNGLNVTRKMYPDSKRLRALIEWQLRVLD